VVIDQTQVQIEAGHLRRKLFRMVKGFDGRALLSPAHECHTQIRGSRRLGIDCENLAETLLGPRVTLHKQSAPCCFEDGFWVKWGLLSSAGCRHERDASQPVTALNSLFIPSVPRTP
jgi:hypothetical protein